MADDGDGSSRWSDDFSFTPVGPAAMSPTEFWGFIQGATPEQVAMMERYMSSRGTTSATPTPVTTATQTPMTTAVPTPDVTAHATPDVTPLPTPDLTPRASPRGGRRRRRSGASCCGGASDASTPPRERPSIASMQSSPASTPRSPWSTQPPASTRRYTISDRGVPTMDAVGKEMKLAIRQLCSIQFGHQILKKWDDLDADRKNYIVEEIKRRFIPVEGHPVVPNTWIKSVMISCMSHKRSEARDAFKEGKAKPSWLDAEEWREIQRDAEENPNKFQQQRDAARSKNESVGSSHLGSGGYETLREEFMAVTGREIQLAEERFAYKFGTQALFEQLEREGTPMFWDNLR